MTELTAFVSAMGHLLFGIAAIPFAVAFLRLVALLGRALSLIERHAAKRLPETLMDLIASREIIHKKYPKRT